MTSSPLSLFLVFLRLGLTSFGGPVAHLGYFRTEFVSRRRWLSEQDFADIVALCQFLPGPASSQAGIAIGLMRGGLGGALAAWTGFTLPSALLMIGFAYTAGSLDPAAETKWLHGLLVVAVAVVAQAVWGMSRNFAADLPRALHGRDEAREVVLLAHQPKAVAEASARGVGLVLSGHTHGGQIWPWGYAVKLDQPHVAGLHRHGDSATQIYTSRGTGYWGPPMRVGAPAEVTRLELTRA